NNNRNDNNSNAILRRSRGSDRNPEQPGFYAYSNPASGIHISSSNNHGNLESNLLSGFFRRMFDVGLDLSRSIADPLAAVSSSLMNVNNPQSTEAKTNEDRLEADKKGGSKKKESHTETKEEILEKEQCWKEFYEKESLLQQRLIPPLSEEMKRQLFSACVDTLSLFEWKPVICTNEQEQRLNNKYEGYLKADSGLLNITLTIISEIAADYKYAQWMVENRSFENLLKCSCEQKTMKLTNLGADIMQYLFDEPKLLTEAMEKQIIKGFDSYIAAYRNSRRNRYASWMRESGQNYGAFPIVDPWVSLPQFLQAHKPLIARNDSCFLEALQRCCSIKKHRNIVKVSSHQAIEKCKKNLILELEHPGKWESQDPRTCLWGSYDEANSANVEKLYKEFLQQCIAKDMTNLDELRHCVDVFVDSKRFTIDIRNGVQMNNSGGSRLIRRRKGIYQIYLHFLFFFYNAAASVKEKSQTEQNGVSTTPTNSNQQVSQTQVTPDNNASTASAIGRENPETTAVSSQQSTKLSPFGNSDNRVPSSHVPTLMAVDDSSTWSHLSVPLQTIMDLIVDVILLMDGVVDVHLKKTQTEQERPNNAANEELDNDGDMQMVQTNYSSQSLQKEESTSKKESKEKEKEKDKEKDKLISRGHLIALMASHRLFSPEDMLNVVKNVVHVYPALSKVIFFFLYVCVYM
ncbi:hypothetical protein RFI_13299, partial [Reticulomyxa filosa]